MLMQATQTLFGFRNDVLVAAIIGGLFILAAISAFAAQRWAHRCYVELKAIRESLAELKKSGTGVAPPSGPGSYLDEDQR
ncbi:MAG: hypothetical protein KF754_01540 [Planctomycetes bacterium]|nr:hypothetical protein [Planctomycetota bacterium]